MVNCVSPKFLTVFLTTKGQSQGAEGPYVIFINLKCQNWSYNLSSVQFVCRPPKLSQVTHFSWGNIWFENFALCKRIDLLQLAPVYCRGECTTPAECEGDFLDRSIMAWTHLLIPDPLFTHTLIYDVPSIYFKN